MGSDGVVQSGVGALLVDAARFWKREPGGEEVFPPSTTRRICAAGYWQVLAPLDSLLVVVAVHAAKPLELGSAGVVTPDARLLAVVLEKAVEGEVEGPAVDRLALRLGARGGKIMRRVLRQFAGPLGPLSQVVLPRSEEVCRYP